MSSPIVKVNDLTKKIKNKEIVKNINFDIHKGEILGFLGPNGSGKTTVMKMMVGLMSISEGDVLINNKSIKKQKEKALRYVGGVIEYPELYKFLSGFENLLYFQRITDNMDKERILHLANLVGLSEAIHDKVKTYSLGMKQRLGIAQALISSPDLLILDEPTNGLDPAGILEIREYLLKIAKEENIAIFISSHLLSEMENICDRLIFIQKGQIIDTEYKNFSNESPAHHYINVSLNVAPLSLVRQLLKEMGIDAKEDQGKLIIYTHYDHIPEVVDKLVSNGVKIYSISPVNESLEERYLAKIGGY
ncbi:ABC transporter ATP-binding protein [Neobacillus niacini]|uniref:ABC transporter ATP-binding protein n=1 Tax=Neobacillus niacini TaxID=86668 RepID=UPI0028638FAC|nr:ABC transporter ATP-binding protein [Neobacillus niacini]MDR6999448.1 ABC-2 type transport system ATP-binding protein [Neobacillus niacini]